MSSAKKFDHFINDICDRFEDAWHAEGSPNILDFVNVPAEIEAKHHRLFRSTLIEKLLLIDIEFRSRDGREITPVDYSEMDSEVVDIASALLANRQSDQLPDAEVKPDDSIGTTKGVSELQGSATPRKHIGPYKLLQKIGAGGMGEVWLAQQEEPIRRRVAVKIIKSEVAGEEMAARFEAERQALAMMDHPNIAKILDAGTTESGTPFFVMELVKGKAITEFCDDNKVGIRERLELFAQVCSAIQHAHQKGVIHRDIKPSNVLVAIYDGELVPKVIDFGLAKALGQATRLTDKTLFTEFGKILGTLQYMSPEQAQLDSLDIDTRTDVYSLGILLYELLTGTTPVSKESLAGNALMKVLATIRDVDPPSPSSRLGSSVETAQKVCEVRKTQPVRLSKLLKGELDWIVMKSIAKSRQRRYESASELANEVSRFLNGEPVLARAPSNLYKIQKLISRNRLAACMIATATFFALLGVLSLVRSTALAKVNEAQAITHANAMNNTVEKIQLIAASITENIPDVVVYQGEAADQFDDPRVFTNRIVGSVATHLGAYASKESNFQLSKELTQLAVETFTELEESGELATGDLVTLSTALSQAANAHAQANDVPTAVKLFKRNHEVLESLRDTDYNKIQAHTLLAKNYMNLGNHEFTVENNKKAIEILEPFLKTSDGIQGSNKKDQRELQETYAMCLHNQSQRLRSDERIAALESAVAALEGYEAGLTLAVIYDYLSICLMGSDKDRAIELSKQAERILHELPNERSDPANRNSIIGRTTYNRGLNGFEPRNSFSAAIAALQKSEKSSLGRQSREIYCMALTNRGIYRLENEQPYEGFVDLNNAVETMNRLGYTPFLADVKIYRLLALSSFAPVQSAEELLKNGELKGLADSVQSYAAASQIFARGHFNTKVESLKKEFAKLCIANMEKAKSSGNLLKETLEEIKTAEEFADFRELESFKKLLK